MEQLPSPGAAPEDPLENELTYDLLVFTEVIVTVPATVATPLCIDFTPPDEAGYNVIPITRTLQLRNDKHQSS
jgi:hypothetical protein